MTLAVMLLLAAVGSLLYLVIDWYLGPDPDLESPWHPGARPEDWWR